MCLPPRDQQLTLLELNSIDNMKVDGKFMVGNDIPDGQGAVIGLMEECFELTTQLQVQAIELEEGTSELEVDGGVSLKA
jgi:hypothetical protein